MTAIEARARARILAVIALAAFAWLAAALVPPVMEAGGAPLPALLARAFFSHVCHQIPGRSFWIEGGPMALCARCTGLYAGILVASAGWAIRLAWSRPRKHRLPGRWILIAAAFPTIIDVVAERLGIWPGSAVVRALAGALLAAPLAPLLAVAARELPAEFAAEVGRLTRRIRRTHAGTC